MVHSLDQLFSLQLMPHSGGNSKRDLSVAVINPSSALYFTILHRYINRYQVYSSIHSIDYLVIIIKGISKHLPSTIFYETQCSNECHCRKSFIYFSSYCFC